MSAPYGGSIVMMKKGAQKPRRAQNEWVADFRKLAFLVGFGVGRSKKGNGQKRPKDRVSFAESERLELSTEKRKKKHIP